jgi:hypothetical protein
MVTVHERADHAGGRVRAIGIVDVRFMPQPERPLRIEEMTHARGLRGQDVS